MKKKITYTQDTQTINEMELTSKKFLKKAKEFLMENAQLEKDEILYVVKARETGDGEVIEQGAYYGVDSSPLQFLINSKEHSEDVFLVEATSFEAIREYLINTKSNDNIYVFKVLYKDFKLCKIESFYGGEHDLEFYIFEHDEELSGYGEVLKRLGEVNYAPSINFLSSEDDE